jgi:ABC-type uncharacterized transport system auxiliary subunit
MRGDAPGGGGTRLATDLRQFEIAGSSKSGKTLQLSAKLIDESGRLRPARVFAKSVPLDGMTPAKATAGFDKAFSEIPRELVVWTASVP